VIRLWVWPNDLDISIHMNNGRYLTMMDLGRTDLIIRTGLWRLILRRRLTPVVGTAAIRFRRELRLFQAFDLETRLVGWVDDMVLFEQRFRIASGPRTGQYAATALVRAGLYDRAVRAMVPVAELMRATGREATASPPVPEGAAALLTLDGVMQRETPRTPAN
jgi:acyl-CoA thioesterase FadM